MFQLLLLYKYSHCLLFLYKYRSRIEANESVKSCKVSVTSAASKDCLSIGRKLITTLPNLKNLEIRSSYVCDWVMSRLDVVIFLYLGFSDCRTSWRDCGRIRIYQRTGGYCRQGSNQFKNLFSSECSCARGRGMLTYFMLSSSIL